MPVAKKTGRRPGRPPGAKNKPKVQQLTLPAPVVARSNGVRRTRRTPDRVALAGSIISINRKHMLLIQKWSGETKIGVQQIFDDIFLAGASAAYKSFYRGLINSRKAAEAQFDAEANTQELAPSAVRGAEQIHGLPDSGSLRPPPARRPILDEEQLDLVAVGPGQLEEASPDFEDPVGVEVNTKGELVVSAPPDAPTIAPPEEEPPVEEPEENEPPY